MLSSTAYDQAHVEACRARTERQLAAHAELLRAARAADGDRQRQADVDAWERLLAGDVVLALEAMFLHRARGAEKKGGALKEVRERAAALPAQDPAAPDALDGGGAAALAEAFYAELAQTHVARTPVAAGG